MKYLLTILSLTLLGTSCFPQPNLPSALASNTTNTIDVRAFGAIPNDGLSDSVAVLAAIARTEKNGGGRVFFPIGSYNLPPFNLPNRVVLVGEGNGHASVDIEEHNIRGTVLLIDGIKGKSDIDFAGNTSFSGLENLSVWNNNSADIEAVVKIAGVLYPHLENIEISSRYHTTGAGLLLSAINKLPFFETLYGSYVNVSVITNERVGVHTGLKIISLSPVLRPNASRFIAGHFQGYSLSLLIDGVQPHSSVQGVEFAGTAFESYYNSSQEIQYLPRSVGMNAFNRDSSRYAIIWIKIKQSIQVTFNGCYFENGTCPFKEGYDDGVNGRHQVFPVILLDTNAVQTTITGNTIVAGILDRGYGNTHPNKISFLDANGTATIEDEAMQGTRSNQLSLGTGGFKAIKLRKDTAVLGKVIVENFIKILPKNLDTSNYHYYNLVFDTADSTIKKMNSISITGHSIFSGNGITNSFNFSHPVLSGIQKIFITPTTDAAGGYRYLDNKGQTATIHFTKPPPTGANNIQFDWEVKN